jgi:hypothetical protein
MPAAATTTFDALHIRRSGSTSDNLDQLASDHGLAGSVVENLVLANHLTSVFGSVLRELVTANSDKYARLEVDVHP